MKTGHTFGPLLLFLFCIFQVKAQEKAPTQLPEVTVHGHTPVQAPADSTAITPVAAVSARELEEYAPADITPAMNRIPGVFILSGGMNVSRITIRGVGARTPYGSNKVRAYLDGIPVTNGMGETALEVFDPENMGNIEIIEGPKATAYGAPLGGTILLRSATPGTSSVSTSLTAGSYQLLKNTTHLSVTDRKLSLGLNYEHLETGGYRENSAYNRNAVQLNASYRFDENNTLSLLFSQIGYNAQIPSSISRQAMEEDPGQAASNWLEAQGYKNSHATLAGLSYTHRFTASLQNTTSVFYTYLDHYEPRPFNILTGFTNGYGIRSTFGKDFTFGGRKGQVQLGTEMYKDVYQWGTIENLYQQHEGGGSAEGRQLSDNKEYRNQLNLFTTLTLPLAPRLKARLGLNANFTSYNFLDHYNEGAGNTSASRRFDPILAPSLDIDYRYSEHLRFYANISRGFSFPGTEETLTPEGVINPGLGPEKGMHYETGIRLKLLEDRLSVTAAAYLMDIRDLLVAQRVGEDQYIGKNAGKTEHRGIELSAAYHIPVSPAVTLIPFATTSVNKHRFIRFRDGDNDYSGNPLTGVPAYKTSAGFRLTHRKGLFLYANYLGTGKIPLTDGNTLHTDPYHIFNLKAGFRTSLYRRLSLQVSGGINNAGNSTYASSVLINATGFGNTEPRFYYPGLPRNYYAGVRLRYML
ncbi:TonB-dependent receptor family protein [Sinomicrobium soli]|uniref:TonB-dependent receptor family protein n=1 Tax=Sinomicrobium sp. N-1-3-6 TaxID=2219864 RepID=UPI000DCBC6EB|nr:TonB-dependent receptor [Sinomicrobium sp. N-1-3-6]RAV27905.1 TonB-dependent receptor [Sinomicrobium sp. N-1-3-6]